MKPSSRTSQSSSGLKSKRYVKNQLQIGDARPDAMTKPDGRSSSVRLTSSSVGAANHLISQFPDAAKSFRLQDGSSLKREIRTKNPRAAAIYGNPKKVKSNSYEKTVKDPTKTKGTNTKKTQAAAAAGTRRGRTKINRPKNKGLI